MNRIKRNLLLPVLFLGIGTGAFGQPDIELNFQGMLTDAEGNTMSGEHFDLAVKLMSAGQAHLELWTLRTSTKTDADGWFSFTVPEISRYLMDGSDIEGPVVISLEFLPNEKTGWMKQGEDFIVTYTLTPTLRDEAIHLAMTRMEGSQLTMYLEDHLYVFKDEYPFAYLTGGFLLSDNPPVNEGSKGDLRAWILPDPSGEGGATRGVKGAFPRGGYRK